MSWLYLALNLGSFSVPFIASFYPKAPFFKEWRWFLPSLFMVAAFFIIWDEFFTQMGVWGFNPNYVSGYYIGSMPIEELLFFFCIPYSCTFIYFSLHYFIKRQILPKSATSICWLIALIALTIGLLNLDKWYTSTAFLGAAALMVVFAKWNPKWLGHFLLCYLISIVPFLIVNGILTGSFIPGEVVWYNDKENLGIRIFTIPFDDNFYSLLMIGMVIGGYEWLKLRLPISKK